MPKKPRIGRPKLAKGEHKEVFSLRLTALERASVESAAKKVDQRPTEWARMTLIKAAIP